MAEIKIKKVMKMIKRKKKIRTLFLATTLLLVTFWGYQDDILPFNADRTVTVSENEFDAIPEYDGKPYVILNDGEPDFSEEELNAAPYEEYSSLDMLGRCQEAEACIGLELMPNEERESISQIKPTGWINKKYDIVDQGYLYNRCHLIGFQLTGENANERNLITGTRYLNVDGMLPFENKVADYIRETGNHVLYRVTPIYDGADLVASGVQMEAQSVEDHGEGIRFNIYCYNVQPGIKIDYATGDSWAVNDRGIKNENN